MCHGCENFHNLYIHNNDAGMAQTRGGWKGAAVSVAWTCVLFFLLLFFFTLCAPLLCIFIAGQPRSSLVYVFMAVGRVLRCASVLVVVAVGLAALAVCRNIVMYI